MSLKQIILFILLILTIIFSYTFYSLYRGPFLSNFCQLYDKTSKNKYGNLVRLLNNYDLCRKEKYNVFDKYIYWNGEIMAGVKNETLVFKGTDSLRDWSMDLSPTSHKLGNGIIYSNIISIYRDIESQLNSLHIKRVVGWSLGSILATIYSFERHTKYNDTMHEIILFGFPPAFDEKFHKEYNDILYHKTSVYNHKYDIFAHPFWFMGFPGLSQREDFYNVGKHIDTHYPKANLYKIYYEGFAFYHLIYLR